MLDRLADALFHEHDPAAVLYQTLTQAAKQATRVPPPAGWQRPAPGGDSQALDSRSTGELDMVLGLLHSVRDLVPAELQRRLAEALRELLLALRALVDWLLERSELRRAEPVEVQDIPIL